MWQALQTQKPTFAPHERSSGLSFETTEVLYIMSEVDKLQHEEKALDQLQGL
jgi:hypothetical protein